VIEQGGSQPVGAAHHADEGPGGQVREDRRAAGGVQPGQGPRLGSGDLAWELPRRQAAGDRVAWSIKVTEEYAARFTT
jgi:hypothetical protein